MTVREPGKNLSTEQTRLNNIVVSAERQLGRAVDAIIAVKPNELLLLFAVSSGKDVVANRHGSLIQLPKLFDGVEEREYLRLQDILEACAFVKKQLNVYLVYQVLAQQERTPVCLVAVKKTSESMASLKFFTLNQRVASKDDTAIATVTLGKQLPLHVMGIRSHNGYVSGNEARIFSVINSLYTDEKLPVLPRTIPQIWKG